MWAGILLCFLVTTQLLFGANTITLYETSATTQTNRPDWGGRAFAEGEIACYPKVQVGGVTPSVWQENVKNRWNDGLCGGLGSVKFAFYAYQTSLTSGQSKTISFINDNTGSHTGGLTWTQMKNFDIGSGAGNFDPSIVVSVPSAYTSSGTAQSATFSAKTILNAQDPTLNTECGNQVWVTGPVVTAVILQDCTSASAYDAGWHWDGSLMNDNAGAAFTGNSQYATNHPMFVLWFFPTWGPSSANNSILADSILELPWSTRIQDQLEDVTIKGGWPLATQWAHVGARKVTDIVTSNGSTTVTSASSANFVSTDAGLPLAVCGSLSGCNGSGAYTTNNIASVTNSTTAVMYDGYFGTHIGANTVSYINLQVELTRHRKSFWSGPQPAKIRKDLNWTYLKSTMLFPNYDPTGSVNPEDTGHQAYDSATGATTFTQWLTFDKGEWGGRGGVYSIDYDLAANSEGAPIQRENLGYYYNMGSCGTAGGNCAKFWAMLTGDYSTADGFTCTVPINGSSVACNAAGGIGVWNNTGNFPEHMREGRTTATGTITSGNKFYCDNLASKDVKLDGSNPVGSKPAGTCGTGALGTATGKPFSRHAHSSDQWSPGGYTSMPSAGPVGTISNGPSGWAMSGYDHWQDFIYDAYLTTADPYYMQEEQFQASQGELNPDPATPLGGGYFFNYANPRGAITRELAWALQSFSRASTISPDGSPEQAYYLAKVNTNLEVQEGIQEITGTTLTPASSQCNFTDCTAGQWNYTVANAWDWGRYLVASICQNTGSGTCVQKHLTLHSPQIGAAPDDDGNVSYLSVNKITVGGLSSCSTLPQINITSVIAGVVQNSLYIANSGTSGCTGSCTCSVLGSTGSSAACSCTQSGGHITAASITNGGTGYQDANVLGYDEYWMVSYLTTSLMGLRELGFSQAAPVHTELLKGLEERLLDTTSNPYTTVGGYLEGITAPTPNTAYQSDYNLPIANWYTSYAQLTNSFPSSIRNITKYDGVGVYINIPCGDHGYSVVGRAAATGLNTYNPSSTDANCASGTCKGTNGWIFASHEIPQMGVTPTSCNRTVDPTTCSGAASTACAATDEPIKFFLTPRSSVTITSCDSLSPSSATINTSATQNFTASCTYSDSSTGDCTSSLVLTSGSPSVATVSGQIATGVSAGSSTISGTANSFACGNTSALTVQNPATQTIKITGGVTLKGGVTIK